jgi:UDP-galactopyranose mutase
MSKPHFDFLVADAGISGAVVAERLAEHGKSVLVVDKREHVGGETFDELDPTSGLLVQRHGLTVFHSNSIEVFNYLSKFTHWRPYQHRVLAQVGTVRVPFPVNLDTINLLAGWELDAIQCLAFIARVAVPLKTHRSLEEKLVSQFGRELYDKLFRAWAIKRWGYSPAELVPDALPLGPVRMDRDARAFTDAYQAVPADGFTPLVKKLLGHSSIRVELGTDYRDVVNRVNADQLVYAGTLDEFFGGCFGPLPWSYVETRFETFREPFHQEVAELMHCDEQGPSRVIEFKHLTGEESPFTTLAFEYPSDHGEPHQPVPRLEYAERHRRYEALAARVPGVHFLGRLAHYRDLELDESVAEALVLANRLLDPTHVTRGDA